MAWLPVELYRPVIQHVNQRGDLTSLALTSRVFRSEAEPHLYRELHLWDPVHAKHWPHPKQLQLLAVLQNSPRLASYVHSFSFKSHPDMYERVPPVLRATANLKRLAVSLSTTQPLYVYTVRSSFNLEWMKLETIMRVSTLDAEFLEKQTELKELEWYHHELLATFLPPFVMGKLEVLSLSGGASARPILLQQIVTHLSQESAFGRYDKEDVFASVRSLRMSKPLQVRQAKQFLNLVYLWTTTFPDSDAIPLLKSLKKISICPDDTAYLPPWQRSRSCSVTLFALSDSLDRVQVRGTTYAYEFWRNLDQPGGENLAKEFDEEEWRFW